MSEALEMEVVEEVTTLLPIKTNAIETSIRSLTEKFQTIPEDYEELRLGVGECRTLRVSYEKLRKELKAPAIDYGKKVDEYFKSVQERIESLEIPLKEAKQVIDDEKERIKAEKAAKEAARVAAINKVIDDMRNFPVLMGRSGIAEIESALHRAEDFEVTIEQFQEFAKLAQSTKDKAIDEMRALLECKREELAESERMAAERQKMEAERAELNRLKAEAESQRKEQERQLQADRDALQAERNKIELEKADAAAAQEAREKAQRDAEAKAEREAAAKEQAAKEESRRLARLPELERLAAFAPKIQAIIDELSSIHFTEIGEAQTTAIKHLAAAIATTNPQ